MTSAANHADEQMADICNQKLAYFCGSVEEKSFLSYCQMGRRSAGNIPAADINGETLQKGRGAQADASEENPQRMQTFDESYGYGRHTDDSKN